MPRNTDPVTFLARLRNRFQLGVFVLTIAIGLQFCGFVLQAGGSGALTIRRPPGVEGFLPIGALLGWKHLATTARWDPIHPAAMVILLYAAGISLLFRRSFCSWFCPVGTLSEWLWKAGHRMFGRNRQLPLWLDGPLRSLKYVLLAFFVYVILQMTPSQVAAFLNSPYYKLADVRMLHFFTRMDPPAIGVLAALALLAVVIRNFWCRYLCPYGALMALLAFCSPARIRRRPGSCTACRKCSRVCPSHLPVHKKDSIASPACSSCLDCIAACPSAGTLTLSVPGLRNVRWRPAHLALVIGGLFMVVVAAAQMAGHWQSGLSAGEFRMLLRAMEAPVLSRLEF